MKHKIKNIHFVGTPDAPHRHRQPAVRRVASQPMSTWTGFIEGELPR